MYWFRRPPYLRWIAASLVLVFGLFLDTHSVAMVRYPFAGVDIAAGTQIDTSITWREVPEGLLPTWSGEVAGVSGVDIATNNPLLPSVLATAIVPADWWAISLPLPAPVTPGARIRVVLDTGSVVEGLVVDGNIDGSFGLSGTVAFASGEASLVASAAANSALTVMIAAGGAILQPSG